MIIGIILQLFNYYFFNYYNIQTEISHIDVGIINSFIMFNNRLIVSFVYRVAVRRDRLVQPGILPFWIEHRRQRFNAVHHTVRTTSMRTKGTEENDCSSK